MIRSLKGSKTEQFVTKRKCKFAGMDEELARQRLSELDDFIDLNEISKLKSVGLHKLTGDLRGHWSININGPWRLVFKFKDGDAYEVQILDPHGGRRRRE